MFLCKPTAAGKVLKQWCRWFLAQAPTGNQPDLQSIPIPLASGMSSLDLSISPYPYARSPSDLCRGVEGPRMTRVAKDYTIGQRLLKESGKSCR